jgi:hypothetical protein
MDYGATNSSRKVSVKCLVCLNNSETCIVTPKFGRKQGVSLSLDEGKIISKIALGDFSTPV